jgi:hypothetical protein
MNRIEVNLNTNTTNVIPLTADEQAQAQTQYVAWQVEEAARLAQKSLDDARQIKFEEWLSTQVD